MNFVSKAFFLFLIGTSPAFAKRCLQALLINEIDRAEASLIHFEPMTSGGYRATHNIPQIAHGTSDVTIDGVAYPFGPSAAAAPALHFFYNAYLKNIVSDRDVAIEMRRLNDMAPSRSIIFANGDWVTSNELKKLQAAASLKPRSIPPIPIAIRFSEQPYYQDLASSFAAMTRLGPDAVEFLIPKNLLTLSSAQKFQVGQGLARHMLPWQNYKEYFDYEIPPNVLAFESGKASAEVTKQFPEMLHATAFAMLKEATAFYHPHDLVINYVHSPDEQHHRLYEIWGLKVVQESKTNNGHRLYAITLEQMLELPRFDPTDFSERLSLVKKYSDREIPFSQARLIAQTIQQSMSVYLDADFAPMGEPGSRIRIDDRSHLLEVSTRALLRANGITQNAGAFLNDLNQIKTARYNETRPQAYLPEEFDINHNEGNIIIQELSHQCALKDPAYLAKALLAVSKWYSQKMAPFATQTQLYQSIGFTVVTKSKLILEQANAVGLSVRKLKHKPLIVVNHHGGTLESRTDEDFYAIIAPMIIVDAKFSNLNWTNQVQQGQWALEKAMHELASD